MAHGDQTNRARRGRRIALAAVCAVLVVALAVAVVLWRPWQRFGGAGGEGQACAGTCRKVDVSTLKTQPVTRGVLDAETTLGGTLDYDAAAAFPAASGTITQLPAVGTVVNTGEQVYEMDGRAVPLFHGSRPFWRTLSVGATNGPDIAQLEQNLKELGVFRGEPDNVFDAATAAAIRQWQRNRGLGGGEVNGVFDPSQVALATQAPVRITQVTAKPGETGVSPATYTGTALHVSATITSAQASQFKAGDQAKVIMPDNTTIDTTLSAVDMGGQPVGEQGEKTQPSARIDFPDQAQVANYGTTSVRVSIPNTAADMTETLLVPVTALIATAGNGYAVEVVRGGTIERIPVEIGRAANAQVQITKADNLNEGDKVVIA